MKRKKKWRWVEVRWGGDEKGVYIQRRGEVPRRKVDWVRTQLGGVGEKVE